MDTGFRITLGHFSIQRNRSEVYLRWLREWAGSEDGMNFALYNGFYEGMKR